MLYFSCNNSISNKSCLSSWLVYHASYTYLCIPTALLKTGEWGILLEVEESSFYFDFIDKKGHQYSCVGFFPIEHDRLEQIVKTYRKAGLSLLESKRAWWESNSRANKSDNQLIKRKNNSFTPTLKRKWTRISSSTYWEFFIWSVNHGFLMFPICCR